LVDSEILATKLSRLREAMKRLQTIAAKPRDEYLASETDTALSEHYLRIALEAMLDGGNHVIAEKGLRKPQTLREIPLILGENGVITTDLATRLAGAASLRNLLVHRYADIDHRLVYDALRKDLVDLEEFARAIAGLLRT
jgi:uncharacterized protein YutE (UPF0331/DUF86 family)